MGTLAGAALLGIGATGAMDLWTLLRRKLLGSALPDYGLVGRWLAHLARGRFHHAAIARSAAVRGERVVGWVAHYLVGIGFAGAMLASVGDGWLRQPTLAPALVLGLVTVAAPFFVLQPAMGAGIAASRTRNPGAARRQSVITHLVFGLGIYASGTAMRVIGAAL
jgi:hypothetical protein